MLKLSELQQLKKWFSEYTKKFITGDNDFDINFYLKIAHTKRVCKEIVEIAKSINLAEEDLLLAELIGLFHDIGRFEQYAQFHTFSDRISKNHAVLGLEVLTETKVLDQLDIALKSIVYKAIENHNKISISEEITGVYLQFSKLIRDADKLDIYKVVTDYYGNQNAKSNQTLVLGLPDLPEISTLIYEDIMNRRVVRMENMVTLNDFKIVQIGWVFDIYFLKTYQLINERKYLEMIIKTLPESDKTENIKAEVLSYLKQKIKNI